MKKILFVASEGVPFIKTGGLADVVGSLPKYFDKRYFDARVILPKYMCMKEEMKSMLQYRTHFYMDFAWRSVYVGIMEAYVDGIHYYFIDNEEYFGGTKPYGLVVSTIANLPSFTRTSLLVSTIFIAASLRQSCISFMFSIV